MAYDPISTGTVPNDNTGTPLNAAMVKVNAMFLELYNMAATFGIDLDIQAQIAALAAVDADYATLLAAKANAVDLASKAESADVVKHTGAQALTLLEKAQFAANGGHYVVIPFEVLSSAIILADGDYLFELPRLPVNFICQDANLTVHLCNHEDPADIEFHAELNHAELPVLAQANHVPLPVTGVCPMTVTVENRRVSAGTPLKLIITVTNAVGSAGGIAHGLTLWLRGVWEF